MDATITKSGSVYQIATALTKDNTTCEGFLDFVGSNLCALDVMPAGSTTSLLSTNVQLSSDEGILNTILAFGPVTGMKALVVNSGEVDTPLKLFICDLGVTDTANYQVFIKNITDSSSVQTSPVQGLDGSRMTPFAIDTPGTYEVDLVNGSTVVATSQFVIDSDHPVNIAAFIDNPSGAGLVPRLIHAAEGCVAPAKAH